MNRASRGRFAAACVLTPLLFIACEQPHDVTGATPAAAAMRAAAVAAPTPLVTVAGPAGAVEFWPFLGPDFSGAPAEALDPINLLFVGRSDPRALAAGLRLLDGDRTAFGFPNAFPFNCTWHDVPEGNVEFGYATGAGWLGAAVQLACGDFSPLRFHLRLADGGEWTIANAHVDLHIPGTADHQVISWELAEQLVTVDMLRSGLLDPSVPLFPTDQINPAPFREIPAIIYNGMPVDLRGAIGGPLGDVTAPVPIGTDGHATVFNVAGLIDGTPGVARLDYVLEYDQIIPKPFCASGPFDFIYITGPVRLQQVVALTPSGNYLSAFQALGHLEVTPVNPLTDPPTPIGDTFRAVVNEHHKGIMTDNVTLTSSFQLRILIPAGAPFSGRLLVNIQVGPGGATHSDVSVRCN